MRIETGQTAARTAFRAKREDTFSKADDRVHEASKPQETKRDASRPAHDPMAQGVEVDGLSLIAVQAAASETRPEPFDTALAAHITYAAVSASAVYHLPSGTFYANHV